MKALTFDDQHAMMWVLALLPTKCVIWESWLTPQGLKFLTYEITVIIIMIINKSSLLFCYESPMW